MSLIQLKDVYKIYAEGQENQVNALDGVTLSIDQGEFVAIIGTSGSGKSTMMNILGCLDADAKQLADEMRLLYEQMPHACITTVGMMHRVPFTLSCGVAGLEDVQAKNWQTLYEKCDERLRAAQAIGGDCIREH